MRIFWPKAGETVDADEERVFQMARKTYLSTLLLVALVNSSYVIAHSTTPISARLRLLNIATGAYALGVLVYATRWIATAWRYRKTRSVAQRHIDTQTGLLNWLGLWEAVQAAHADRRRSGDGVSLVHIHVTGIDEVNAKHGRPVGDEVLTGVARFFKAQAPPGCEAGRIGGDEFLLVLPGFGEAEAHALGDAFIEKVREGRLRSVLLVGAELISASVKVLPCVAEDKGLLELLQSARAAPFAQDTPGGGRRGGPCAVPEVTLGAVACFAWEDLPPAVRKEFAAWRAALDADFTSRMAHDLRDLLALRAESKRFDFVTSLPCSGHSDEERALEALGRGLADLLGVPWRQVMSYGASSTVAGHVEPVVGAFIEKGSHVLMVHDLVESERVLRQCVQKLSDARAFVQMVAWAAKDLSETA